eukprot:6131548-Alexandrium_andersonii.AAC.1
MGLAVVSPPGGVGETFFAGARRPSGARRSRRGRRGRSGNAASAGDPGRFSSHWAKGSWTCDRCRKQ